MSKPVKELIRREMKKRFEGVTSLAVVGFSGLDGVATNQIRGRLLKQNIQVAVVKNSLARQAFKELNLEAAGTVLDGPCAIAWGGDSVVSLVRELLAIGKDAPALTVKAAMMDGEVFGADRVEALSRYPTRAEAIAKLAACVLAPARKLAACVLSPGARIAGVLKTLQDKQGGGDSEPSEAAA